MTAQEKWNIIVDQYNEYFNESEAYLQRIWERIFAELFGYNSFCREIDSQRSLKIGSRERVVPDIILRKNDKDLVNIELKLLSASFDTQMEDQLISYLKLLGLSIGILICKKLYVYKFDYGTAKAQRVAIDFIKDNADGIRFVELFQKENYAKSAIEDFVSTKNVFSENVKLIREEISSEFVKQLVTKHFETSFTRDEIDCALGDYIFECKKESIITPRTIKTKTLSEDKKPKIVAHIAKSDLSEVEKIQKVIESLGGVAKLSEIYKEFFETYGNYGVDKEASIRVSIYANTSDSNMWGTPLSTGRDLFYRAGKGRWGNRK